MDSKTMATKSTEVNPTIEVTRNIDTAVVPGDFHEFMGSQAKMYVTYDNRREQIASALGNKASVKG